MTKETHVGLVRFGADESLIGVRYYKSKFEKELGDPMKIDGDSMSVAVIAANRNEVVDRLNRLITIQNKVTRMKNKRVDKKFWDDAIKDINK